MPDTAVLNIINLNIDSIQADITNCKQTEDMKCMLSWRAVQTGMQV